MYCCCPHNSYRYELYNRLFGDMEEAVECWHAGLITVLECSLPDVQIHVYIPQPSSQAISLHDVAAEADMLHRMHASGMITLHQDCSEGVPCAASLDGVSLQGNEGLVAPGVKLYPHRKKWQDSSMRVYNEEEEDEDEDDA